MSIVKPTFSKNQNGFTLLELVVVIILISILGLFATDRIWKLQAAAERAAVNQIIGNLKSTLGLEVARLALDGKINSVAKLANANPILLLAQAPSNYIGEIIDGAHITKTGIWYFDNKQNALIYNVSYSENFTTTLEGIPRIRHRIKLVYNDRNNNNRFDIRYDSIAGLDLFAVEKYNWNITIDTQSLIKE